MEKYILHCDMNNCYASIEQSLNPKLKGKDIIVCGSVEDRHGIVLAKSQTAKMKGVKTGETIWEARLKCPGLIEIEPHFDKYISYSKAAHQIYLEYTDQVEPFGIDECWLDCSGSTKIFGRPDILAFNIKERIKKELNLTISVGVSFTKVFAKLGSDMKKPDAVTLIPRGQFKEKIFPLPAEAMIGVGRATKKKLNKYGINTLGNLADSDPKFIKKILGINGLKLWNSANGIEINEVNRYNYKTPIKSIGHGMTFSRDLLSNEEVKRMLLYLSQDVSKKLLENGLAAYGVCLTVKNDHLHSISYRAPLCFPSQNSVEISELCLHLFLKNFSWQKNVRSLTLRAINLVDAPASYQCDLSKDFVLHEKNESIAKSIYQIRKKYGDSIISFASIFERDKLVKDEVPCAFNALK